MQRVQSCGMAWGWGLVRALTKDGGRRIVGWEEPSLTSVERQAEMSSAPPPGGTDEEGGEDVEGGDRGEGSSRAMSARLLLPGRLPTPHLQVPAVDPSTSG